MSRGIRIGAGSGPAGDLLVTGLFSIAGYPHLSVAGSGSSPPPVNYTASLLTGFFTLTGLPHTSTANKLAFVNTSPLPAATQGAAYTDQLTMSSGQAPFTFTITAGVLPASMSMSGAGLISGTPSVQGTSTFTVRCADNAGQVATQQFSLTVAAAAANLTFTWNPGLYPVSYQNQGVQARGLAAVLASPWYAAVKAEIDQVVANKNGALGFSICVFWTDVDYQGGGVYDWSAVDAIWTYLKTVWPTGRLNVIWQSYRNRANITAASLTSNSIFTDYVIPGWIANAPNGKITVGGTQYTMAAQPNGQYGFFFANWGITGTDANGVANKWTAYALPAIYDPGIAAAYAAAWASGGSHVLPAVTSGGATYGGNAMSAEPYIELTLCQDEYSVVNAGLAASAPPGWTGIPSTGPANAGTAANYFAGTQTIYGTVGPAWGKLTGTCDSFAYIGTTSDTASSWFGQTGYVAQRATLRGVALCNADVYSSSFDTTLSWMTSAQQAYIGEAAPFSNSGFVTPTLPGWIGSMPFIAQFQPADFYSKLATGVTARSAATVASLAGAGQGLRATHFLPWITSPKADGSVDITQWGSLYGPAWGANLSAISTLLPTSLMAAPIVSGVLSGTSVTLTWAAQNGVTWNIYRTTVQGGVGALIGTAPAGSTGYTDPSPPLNTVVYYTVAMTNSNGTGPRGPAAVVTTLVVAVNAQGKITRNGVPFQPHGVNIYDAGSNYRQNWNGVSPNLWNGTGWPAGGPDLAFLKANFPSNVIRLTPTDAAWLSMTCYDVSTIGLVQSGIVNGVSTYNLPSVMPGTAKSYDLGFGGQYKKDLIAFVDLLTANGYVVIFDLHLTQAPVVIGGVTYNLIPAAGAGQQQLPTITGLTYWADVAATFKNYPNVIFDLFNEPFNVTWAQWKNGTTLSTMLYQDGNPYTYVMTFTGSVGGATSGTLTQSVAPGNYFVTFSNGNTRTLTVAGNGISCSWSGSLTAGTVTTANYVSYYITINQSQTLIGMSQMLSTVRTAGFKGPVMMGGIEFSGELGGTGFADNSGATWLSSHPADTLNPPQIICSYHAYPALSYGQANYGTTYGSDTSNFPVVAGKAKSDILGVIAAGLPVMISEIGGDAALTHTDEPFTTDVTGLIAGQTVGSIGGTVWSYNPTGVGSDPQYQLVYLNNGVLTMLGGQAVVWSNWSKAQPA